MPRGGADAGGVRLPPLHDFLRRARLRTAKRWLSSMRLASGDERCTSGGTTTVAALLDSQALHVGNLREDCEYQFSCATPDLAKPTHFDDDVLIQQFANGGLNVERIATESINGVYADHVAAADVPKQFCEGWAICRKYRSRDTLIYELALEGPTQRRALCFDRLIGGR